MDEQKSVNITYSAQEQKKKETMQAKYDRADVPGSMETEKIRRLEARCEKKSLSAALTIGIIGTLLCGVSLTCFLVWDVYVWGGLAGLTGLASVISALPVYLWMMAKEQKSLRGMAERAE